MSNKRVVSNLIGQWANPVRFLEQVIHFPLIYSKSKKKNSNDFLNWDLIKITRV